MFWRHNFVIFYLGSRLRKTVCWRAAAWCSLQTSWKLYTKSGKTSLPSLQWGLLPAWHVEKTCPQFPWRGLVLLTWGWKAWEESGCNGKCLRLQEKPILEHSTSQVQPWAQTHPWHSHDCLQVSYWGLQEGLLHRYEIIQAPCPAHPPGQEHPTHCWWCWGQVHLSSRWLWQALPGEEAVWNSPAPSQDLRSLKGPLLPLQPVWVKVQLTI